MGLPAGGAWEPKGLGHESFHHKSTGWHPDVMTQTWLSQCPALLLEGQAGEAVGLPGFGKAGRSSLDPGKVTL